MAVSKPHQIYIDGKPRTGDNTPAVPDTGEAEAGGSSLKPRTWSPGLVTEHNPNSKTKTKPADGKNGGLSLSYRVTFRQDHTD